MLHTNEEIAKLEQEWINDNSLDKKSNLYCMIVGNVWIFSTIISFMLGFYWGILLSTILCALLLIWITNIFDKKGKKEKDIFYRKKEALYEQVTQKYLTQKQSLIDKYGNPDRVFSFTELTLDKEIDFFEESQRIWVNGHDLSMSDIISIEYDDQFFGGLPMDSHVDTKDALKRALAGGVIGGPIGAVIGGATAKRKTETTFELVLLSITIYLNNISLPMIEIYPANRDDYEEIIAILKLIISRNKSKNS